LDADIMDMQIYRTGNRLFMIMEVGEQFDPMKKAMMDPRSAMLLLVIDR
jgi:L-rhamnose mutarotase